jgi:glucosamine-6-phosphate deaminase
MLNLISTIKDSCVENYYPKGWDFYKILECCKHKKEDVFERQSFWHKDFTPVMCKDMTAFEVKFGHEIALTIKEAREKKQKLAMILPAGPVGMYKWAVFFLKEWKVSCDHLYTFSMDEWSDSEGNELGLDCPGSFGKAIIEAFYKPLGELAPPHQQRYFATRSCLPTYVETINRLRREGAQLVTVFGIGRCFHIAFWEPHFAEEFETESEWKKAAYRLGAKLNPLTIEQNALWWFKGLIPAVPARANTIGPGIFLSSDKIIGGCYGTISGMALWTTLRYSPSIWVPSSFMPTMPGKLFFTEDATDALIPDSFYEVV